MDDLSHPSLHSCILLLVLAFFWVYQISFIGTFQVVSYGFLFLFFVLLILFASMEDLHVSNGWSDWFLDFLLLHSLVTFAMRNWYIMHKHATVLILAWTKSQIPWLHKCNEPKKKKKTHHQWYLIVHFKWIRFVALKFPTSPNIYTVIMVFLVFSSLKMSLPHPSNFLPSIFCITKV